MRRTPLPEAVAAFANWAGEGNVIPHRWYRNITFANGKADQNAITILSELVYWYRPVEVLDERTGAVVARRKKFSGDMLQRSYQALGDKFGMTKLEATRAVDRLVQAGLVNRVIRHTVATNGGLMRNVVYLEPIFAEVQRCTDAAPEESAEEWIEDDECQDLDGADDPELLNSQVPLLQSISTLESGLLDFKVDTYTEITTEINSDRTTDTRDAAGAETLAVLDASDLFQRTESPEVTPQSAGTLLDPHSQNLAFENLLLQAAELWPLGGKQGVYHFTSDHLRGKPYDVWLDAVATHLENGKPVTGKILRAAGELAFREWTAAGKTGPRTMGWYYTALKNLLDPTWSPTNAPQRDSRAGSGRRAAAPGGRTSAPFRPRFDAPQRDADPNGLGRRQQQGADALDLDAIEAGLGYGG